MPPQGVTPLEAEEADLQSRLATVREARGLISKLRELLDAHPGMRTRLAAELRILTGDVGEETEAAEQPAAQAPGGSTRATAAGDQHRPALPLHVRIKQFIAQGGNRPVTIRAMGEAVGASDPTVRKIICQRHRNDFQRVHDPLSAAGVWRLRGWPPRDHVQPESADAASGGESSARAESGESP